ncbi:hypothetical protein AJ79_07453 [Helicocarpus griseus UAMH5409]|uniref:Mitochondrial GTPase 1 n=1 Tax=Helicocarpus griseus UAMH5409 TaxID=1447875 RepID=A0A2B7X254_9EURO|nr:hypothetical protein AJ79_07453 [Helicocarpus griseus UAMH5409]
MSFIPRATFPQIDSIPRTYFLGHHKAGLSKMKEMLSRIDHVIECRDYRIPATSINPVFEEALGDKSRYIVYTKRDLGGDHAPESQEREKLIRKWNKESRVFFASRFSSGTLKPIIDQLRSDDFKINSITGCRVLVVGMPNVGKSSLINNLRAYVDKKKARAAKTGADPGVTRRVGAGLKLLQKEMYGVYLIDTPGVFVPYMPDSESMLKLALCSCVKRSIIPPVTIADYLLYQINRAKQHPYHRFSKPTNEIIPLLESFAQKQGCLGKGGVPDIEAAARKFVYTYETGKMGAFVMDNVLETTLKLKEERLAALGGSINQAKKAEKLAKAVPQVEKVETV